MLSVNLQEVELQFACFVDLAEAGEEIIIVRAGRPVARLVPLSTSRPQPRQLGLGSGHYQIPAEFDSLNAIEIQQMFELGG